MIRCTGCEERIWFGRIVIGAKEFCFHRRCALSYLEGRVCEFDDKPDPVLFSRDGLVMFMWNAKAQKWKGSKLIAPWGIATKTYECEVEAKEVAAALRER